MKSAEPLRKATAPPGHVSVVRINARLNVGGIARHVAWLTAGLAAHGYPSVLVAGIVPSGEEDMTGFVASQGVEPVIVPQMSREISPKDLVTVWKLYRLLAGLRPELIHTHAAKAGAVGRVAAMLYRWLTPGILVGRPRRCRVVHTYHGHVFHSYYGPWKTRLFLAIERALARLATDRIVVISPQQFREIHHTYGVGRPGQFAVVPLGIDLSTYADWQKRRHVLRDELGAGGADILVGIVGRLTEIKNLPLFLQVAALFAKAWGSRGAGRVRFLVIGDGHLRSALEEQARDLGLGPDLTFLGMRNDPEVFYPGLDVLALTSLNEGTPLTVIEAMANARPVIATNVGGVIDLVGSTTEQPDANNAGYAVCERGLLVPSGDSGAFCRGLVRLAEDEPLRRRLGGSGLSFVHEHYSKDRLIQDVADLYADLLDRNGRAGNWAEDCSALETATLTRKGQTCAY
jgi:glycosyltransferase involved in cell wall biosynthesis